MVLISPFYSIRKMVQDKIGRFFSKFIEEKNETFNYIRRNLNLTLIIHGLKDKIVGFEHAEKLQFESNRHCSVVFNEDMGHCGDNFLFEITDHVKYFIYKNKLF